MLNKLSSALFLHIVFQLTDCRVLTYHYGDGSYFIGTVDRQGRPSSGEYYNQAGMLKYNGSFAGGQYDGYGVMYGEDGQQYRGFFHRGEMTGEGMWVNSEEKIEGEFRNGSVFGGAVWERDDGVRFEGVFRRGHAHGPGVVTWRDKGLSLVTTFKKGYPNGGAELHNMLSKEIIWSGQFINGALADTSQIDDDTRNCSIANHF